MIGCLLAWAACGVGPPARPAFPDEILAVSRIGYPNGDTVQEVTRINLHRFDLSDAQVRLLGRFPNLRSLSFGGRKGEARDSERLSTPALKGVLANKKIVDLDLCELADDGYVLLGQSGHLRRLSISQELTTKRFLRLASIRDLRHLFCKITEVDDRAIAALARLPHLHTLELVDYSNSNAARLAPLRFCRSLRDLDLGSCSHVTDATLTVLGRISGLERLRLRSTGVTGSGFGELARLKALKSLDVSCCKIDSACLKKLAAIPRLECLSLEGTPLVDADIPRIIGLPKLQTLILKETGLTADGVKKLRGMMPGTAIEY